MLSQSTQLAPVPDFSLRPAMFELGCAAGNYNALKGNGHYFNLHVYQVIILTLLVLSG